MTQSKKDVLENPMIWLKLFYAWNLCRLVWVAKAFSWMDESLFWRASSHQSTPYLPGFVPPQLSRLTFVTLKLPTPQNTHFRSPSFWRNDFIFHNLNENWPCIYPLPLAHLFPITFRHSNIETEFHIKVTSTAERFIHERNIAAQAYLLSLWLWRSINVGIVYGGVCH